MMNGTFIILPKNKISKYHEITLKLEHNLELNSNYVIYFDNGLKKISSKNSEVLIFGDLKARYNLNGISKLKSIKFHHLTAIFKYNAINCLRMDLPGFL